MLGLSSIFSDRGCQYEGKDLFVDWPVLDTDVLHAATAQQFITNFCDYFQLWLHPPSQYLFHFCVSGLDMAAASTLLIKIKRK